MLQNVIFISTFFLNAKIAKQKQRAQSNLIIRLLCALIYNGIRDFWPWFGGFKYEWTTTYFNDNEVSFAIFVKAT